MSCRLGVRAWSLRCGIMVWGLGFMGLDILGCRVQGLGVRVWGL
jgi:hypothetical protein